MAVSFSGLMSYERCPAQYNHRYGLKTPCDDSGSPQSRRGTRIHNTQEDFMLGKVDELDPELHSSYTPYYREIRETCIVYPELKWAFTKEWERTEFDSPDAWIRGVIDLVFRHPNTGLHGHEYKTGKEYEDHKLQKALYGLVLLMIDAQEQDDMEVTGVYLDQRKNIPASFMRARLGTYKWNWERRIAKTELPIYTKRQGFWCKWCPYSCSKGGPCEF